MTYPWAAGEVLTAADLNAYAGLVLVTSATATSGTALSVNNCFTSQFRSYRIVVTNVSVASITGLAMRMRASGTDATSNNYYYVRALWTYAGVASAAYGNPDNNWQVPILVDNGVTAAVFDVHNPQQTLPTTYTAQGTHSRNAGGFLIGGGKHDVSTAYDGFTLYSAQTISSFTMKVYGYNNG